MVVCMDFYNYSYTVRQYRYIFLINFKKVAGVKINDFKDTVYLFFSHCNSVVKDQTPSYSRGSFTFKKLISIYF